MRPRPHRPAPPIHRQEGVHHDPAEHAPAERVPAEPARRSRPSGRRVPLLGWRARPARGRRGADRGGHHDLGGRESPGHRARAGPGDPGRGSAPAPRLRGRTGSGVGPGAAPVRRRAVGRGGGGPGGPHPCRPAAGRDRPGRLRRYDRPPRPRTHPPGHRPGRPGGGARPALPEAGDPWQPSALYLATHPHSAAAEVGGRLGREGTPTSAFHVSDDAWITTKVDVSPWLHQKLAAILAHRSEVERGPLPAGSPLCRRTCSAGSWAPSGTSAGISYSAARRRRR